MEVFNLIVVLFYFLIGFIVIDNKNEYSKKDRWVLKLLLLFHFFIGIVYYYYTLSKGGDAILYWAHAKEIDIKEFSDIFNYKLGTGITYLICYFPSKILGLNYFQGTIIFSFLGFIGFLYLFKTIRVLVLKKVKMFNVSLFPLILFLPNFHFWSSAVGKDSLLFLLINGIIYFLISKKYFNIIIFSFLIYLIRPHIIFMLIISFGMVLIFDSKIKTYYKFLFFLLAALLVGFLYSKIMKFVNLDSLDLTSIQNYANKKSELLGGDNVGSSIQTSSLSFYLKYFTFLFKPLFFKADNLMSIIASFENLFLLMLTIKFIFGKFYKKVKKSSYIIRGALLFFFISSVSFSLILGNLGIMLRMKNMLMPYFIIVVLWSFQKTNKLV